jgi:glyoxylase-like metal-dependent hydrolase (beta-lactamase superfamily II)
MLKPTATTTPPKPTRQVAGAYHFAVGDIVVTALNDGMFGSTVDFFDYVAGVPRDQLVVAHGAAYRTVPPRIAVNTFLLHASDRLVLVDSGCGSVFGPELGLLQANMAAIGVTPADIDAILMTHLHPDHVGGLVNSSGDAIFPNAELIVPAKEQAYWTDPKILADAPEGQARQWVQLTLSSLTAYRERTRIVTEGEVLPGISAVPEPGHTPGHTGWLVASGSETLLIWGDIVHLHGTQFLYPEASMSVVDVDSEQAIVTRRRIMDMAATDRLRVAGMHLDFPSFGHVVRDGDRYEFVPEPWNCVP